MNFKTLYDLDETVFYVNELKNNQPPELREGVVSKIVVELKTEKLSFADGPTQTFEDKSVMYQLNCKGAWYSVEESRLHKTARAAIEAFEKQLMESVQKTMVHLKVGPKEGQQDG